MNNLLAPDLFGGETPIIDIRYESKFQRFKRVNNYRKGDKENNCGKCNHHFFKKGASKVFCKCELMGCSSGSATDVSSRMVCDKFDGSEITVKQRAEQWKRIEKKYFLK